MGEGGVLRRGKMHGTRARIDPMVCDTVSSSVDVEAFRTSGSIDQIEDRACYSEGSGPKPANETKSVCGEHVASEVPLENGAVG